MKSFLKIAAGVVALSFAQQASADTTFRVTGSTAFRGAVHDTIVALMGGDPTNNTATCKMSTTAAAPTGTPTAADYRAVINGAGKVTFVGTLSGISGTSTVQCSWSGSATGLIAINASTSLTYANASAANTATAGYDTAAFAAGSSDAGAALFALSDVFQTSVTSTPVSGLTNSNIAVVPFSFVANRGTTGLSNVTAQQYRALYATGSQPLSLFTGVSTDTKKVYATGRDGGSGTRITVMAESKYGIANNVIQYYGVTSGTATSGTGTVTSLQYWPTSSIATFDANNAGNGGYGSGGTIATLMGFLSGSVNILNAAGGTDLSAQNCVILSYLGAGDANTAVNTNGAVRLGYEGSTYTSDSTGADKVFYGAYTLWCYEHLNHKGALTSGTDDFKFNNLLKNNVTPNLGVNGLDITAMQVSRTGDGGVVGP